MTLGKAQEGIIIDTVGEIAKVKVARHGDCENCGSCPGENAMVLEVNNKLGATKGQKIIFEAREKNMLKAAFIVYVFPLIAAFIGATVGFVISTKLSRYEHILETIGGITAFILAVALIVFYEKSTRRDLSKLPKVIRGL